MSKNQQFISKKMTRPVPSAGPVNHPQQPQISPQDMASLEAANKKFLEDQHVNIMIPCYGGMMSERTCLSLISFSIAALRLNLKFTIDTIMNESLVTRARNNLVSKFMANKDATHGMFIDADIGFNQEAIFRMLFHKVDVVGAIYPMKSIPIKYVVNILPNAPTKGDLVEVSTLGTGFMMFNKPTISKMFAAYPQTKYADSLNFGPECEQHMYALFDTMINEFQKYYSEDWTFCHRWRAIGGQIWADPKIKLDHIGAHVYSGDTNELDSYLKSLANNGQLTKEAVANLKGNIAFTVNDPELVAQLNATIKNL